MIQNEDMSATEYVILIIGSLIAIVFFSILLTACGAMIFSPFSKIKEVYTDCCNNSITWTILAIHVIIIFTTFLIVLLFSTLIRKLVAKRSIFSRCKCLSLIGYGGIALSGIGPRVAVYFFDGSINWYFAFISFMTCLAINFIILWPNSKNFIKIDYDLDGTFSWFWKHVVIHIIVFIVQVRIAIALFEDGEGRGATIFCQFLYSFICVPSIFDFCQVLRRGGIKLKNHDNRIANGTIQDQAIVARTNTIAEADLIPESYFNLECENCKKNNQNRGLVAGNKKKVKAAKIPERNFKLECKICMLEYNETRIPRMLKECGHTICEVCANELLKKNNQRHLCCPFCQEVTLVNGPANLLPKNYLGLEVIEKM